MSGRVNELVITRPDLIHAVLGKALDRVAMEVLRDAVRYAPRSKLQQPPKNPKAPITGNLKNSITVDSADTHAGPVRRVGTAVYYGISQEFGTASIPPRPFLGPALEIARRKYGGTYSS